jgi:pimeloyl-ACP methyl ester carboxylesterase
MEVHPDGIRTGTHAIAEADLRDVLPRIDALTLLVHGDADVRSPLDIAEDLHANIPGSELAVLPGVGHLCDMEASEHFNAQVRAFLRAAG